MSEKNDKISNPVLSNIAALRGWLKYLHETEKDVINVLLSYADWRSTAQLSDANIRNVARGTGPVGGGGFAGAGAAAAKSEAALTAVIRELIIEMQRGRPAAPTH
jgi:hypothetical protein